MFLSVGINKAARKDALLWAVYNNRPPILSCYFLTVVQYRRDVEGSTYQLIDLIDIIL